ncbi:MAG: HNH endonuclease [Promethearchaeota archaeon]
MAKFDPFKRLAIWDAYDKKCLYCDLPIPRVSDMQIDHVFPVDLEDNPDKFEKLKLQYDLPPDFDLHEFYNLACSCGPCNRKKSNIIREKQVMLTYYSIARKKAEKIKNLYADYKKRIEGSTLVTSFRAIIERKFLKPNEVIEMVKIVKDLIKEVNNPVTITFTITIEEYSDKNQYLLPTESYYKWCDNCQAFLTTQIQNNLSCLYAICEDNRDREGYGVRIAFWGLDWQEFNDKLFPHISGWEIVEVMNFYDFYHRSTADIFFEMKDE